MITQPHRSEEVVTIDRRTEQTMRAWMDEVSRQMNYWIENGVSGTFTGSFSLDDGTATLSGVFMFDDGGA